MQTEADKSAEKRRIKSFNELVAHYQEQAAANSEEYGFLNVSGHEVPDPTVMSPPAGYNPGTDMFEHMRQMIRAEISRAAALEEFETEEEANDFDIDDDVDWSSPWEEYFDPAPGHATGPGQDPPPEPPPAPADAPDRGGGGAEPPSGQAAPTAS